MQSNDAPESIAQRRLVDAMAVLENRVDLRGYPHRYLGVASERGRGAERLSYAIAAAEVLSRYGWDLINITEIYDRNIYALLQRRG
jgi:hypothetical protein